MTSRYHFVISVHYDVTVFVDQVTCPHKILWSDNEERYIRNVQYEYVSY